MLRFILAIAVFGTLSCSKDAPVSPPRAGKARADDVASDRAALVASYKATNGDNWKDNTNWLSEKSLAFWYGVSTDSEGRVKSLQLEDNNLVGSIPAELGQLAKLETLVLSFNPLAGEIPPELGQLTNLEDLRLWGNELTGSIPAELGQLTKLETLELIVNQLTGSIPAELGQLTKLETLRLSNNQLTGAIPTELGQLKNLEFLGLSFNQLTGSIPAELGQLTKLERIQLSNNQLMGSIPAELGQLTKLERLLLGGNQLTGCIPNTLRNFTFPEGEDFDRLEILFCGEDDQLDRAALIAFYQATGGSNWKNKTNWLTDAPLDEWHGVDVDAFGRVTAIRLDDNGLQGAIPPEIKELTALKGLWLGYNQLTDVAEVGHLTGLTQLFLHNNGLYRQPSFANLFTAFQGSEEEPSESGRIPSTFAQLTNLQTLWLSGNQITDISSLENLTDLEFIALNDNQLADISPLENLTNLQMLWLLGNQLTDISPLENLTALRDLDLRNNQLTDISPLENLTALKYLRLSINQLTDISPLENLTNLGFLKLDGNQITDISPLLALMALEEVDLWENPLDSELQTIHTLEERGVLVLFPSIVESVFKIELVYLEDFNDFEKRHIEVAAQRWASIITADLPDYEFTSDWAHSCGGQPFEIRKGERIDDLRIYVGFLDPEQIGLVGGAGSPSLLRDNHISVVGCIMFSPVPVASIGGLNTYLITLHEIGHVLGFGTTWTNNGLLQEPSWDFPNGDPHFNGPLAIAAFDEAGGHNYTGASTRGRVTF